MNQNHPWNKELKTNARALRKNMTPEEKIFWYQFLKNLSVPFYRQRIIGNYIADFYCPAAKLVIELDGSQHFSDSGLLYDAKRDEFMKGNGLKVLRIPNNEIQNNLAGVADLILRYLPKDTTVIK